MNIPAPESLKENIDANTMALDSTQLSGRSHLACCPAIYPVPKEIDGDLWELHRRGTPTLVFAGEEYGTGSSRGWAAKGPRLLGVRAVVAKAFERIHRSNLVGMGVLPLQFKGEDAANTLGILGDEEFDVQGLDGGLRPGQDVVLTISRPDGTRRDVTLTLRLDTPIEVDYLRHGGILPYVLSELLTGAPG